MITRTFATRQNMEFMRVRQIPRTRYQIPSKALAALTLLLVSCAATSPEPVPSAKVAAPRLVRLDAAQCRALLGDDAPQESLRQALARSVAYLERLPVERALPVLDRRLQAGELLGFLRTLPGLVNDGDWVTAVCQHASVHRVEIPEGFLVTGYYQPELRARRKRGGSFQYPLYRTPDDLVDIDLGQWCTECGTRVSQGRVKDGRVLPYYSRGEIEAGALDGRGYEIAWLEDPLDAFFMHVQGSAVLRLEDDVQMHVSYSSSNGRPYTSIGRILIERDKLTRHNVSMQTIKDYLRAHPEEQPDILSRNERYIFFRTVTDGPIGSLGVPLTAGRSIAADAAVYPSGALVFMKIQPRPQTPRPVSTTRFAMIQDAGAAISGPGRIDVFWGTGDTAAELAGDMRNPGELYLVLPRE